MTLTKRETEILRHTLGVSPHTTAKQWGYRNRFLTSVGSRDDVVLEAMAARDLVRLDCLVNGDRLRRYVATIDGCRAIELDDEVIRRALSGH